MWSRTKDKKAQDRTKHKNGKNNPDKTKIKMRQIGCSMVDCEIMKKKNNKHHIPQPPDRSADKETRNCRARPPPGVPDHARIPKPNRTELNRPNAKGGGEEEVHSSPWAEGTISSITKWVMEGMYAGPGVSGR